MQGHALRDAKDGRATDDLAVLDQTLVLGQTLVLDVTAASGPWGEERRRVPRSPIAQPQWAIPRIDVLLPEQVPTRAAILAALDRRTLDACRRAAAGSAADLADALAGLSGMIPEEIDVRDCDPPALMVAGAAASPEVHDHFFRVRRVGHGHPAGYLQSLLAAHRILRTDLEEAASAIDAGSLATIGQALRAALAIGIGEASPSALLDWTPGLRPVTTDHAVGRWIHGHQVFAALTQGLVYAFEAIDAAAAIDDGPTMLEAADLATLLLRACAESLRFAGDFPADVYEDLIRISMGSPFQPDGFSGLLSSDHRHLVRRMKLTKASLDALNERDAARHAGIAAALAGVYDAHKCVCSRFVGTDRSSLMMVREVGRSAIDHLDRFKSARLRAIGVLEEETVA